MRIIRYAFFAMLISGMVPAAGFAAESTDGPTSATALAATARSAARAASPATRREASASTSTLAVDVASTATALANSPTSTTLTTRRTTDTLVPPLPYSFLLAYENKGTWESLRDGVWIRDIHVGKGKLPSKGVAVYLNLVGHLEDGTVFLNTKKKKKQGVPQAWFVYTYGSGEVMKSLEDAILTMREGGRRLVYIPAEQAYGEHGYNPPEEDAHIPPNANLIFEVTLLWIREPEFHKLDMFK